MSSVDWNYDMDQTPKDGTWILVSDGEDVWSVRYVGSHWYCGWYNDEYCEEIIAWAPIDLPKQKDELVHEEPDTDEEVTLDDLRAVSKRHPVREESINPESGWPKGWS